MSLRCCQEGPRWSIITLQVQQSVRRINRVSQSHSLCRLRMRLFRRTHEAVAIGFVDEWIVRKSTRIVCDVVVLSGTRRCGRQIEVSFIAQSTPFNFGILVDNACGDRKVAITKNLVDPLQLNHIMIPLDFKT